MKVELKPSENLLPIEEALGAKPRITATLPRNRPRFNDPPTQEEIAATRARQPRTDVRNRPAVVQLGASDYMHFRGVTYRVDPVSFEDGTQLQSFMMRLAELREATTAEQLADYLPLLREIAAAFRRLVVPVNVYARLAWTLKLTRNPFRRASEGEIGELLGFFWKCRTTSTVRLPTMVERSK